MQKQTNPLGTIHNATGQRLPDDFSQKTINYGGTFDRRKLEDMWKTPNFTGKSFDNIVQRALLSRRPEAEDDN